jgi:hypothetical protein
VRGQRQETDANNSDDDSLHVSALLVILAVSARVVRNTSGRWLTPQPSMPSLTGFHFGSPTSVRSTSTCDPFWIALARIAPSDCGSFAPITTIGSSAKNQKLFWPMNAAGPTRMSSRPSGVFRSMWTPTEPSTAGKLPTDLIVPLIARSAGAVVA